VKIKALTLWQPWASLMALGHKTVETRSWKANHLGLLAIHAAKRPMGYNERELLGSISCGKGAIRPTGDIPYGAVVCIVNVTGYMPTEKFSPNNICFVIDGFSPYEQHLGDYSPGRWGWTTELVFRLTEPIPCQGHQGLWLWDVPAEIERELLEEGK